MKRSRSTSFAAPPPASAPDTQPDQPTVPSWRELAPVVAALIVALDAMEAGPKAGPALKAHRSALRRQGQAAAAIGGTEAMEVALHQVAEADLARAETRTRLISEAWSDLPGWRV